MPFIIQKQLLQTIGSLTLIEQAKIDSSEKKIP